MVCFIGCSLAHNRNAVEMPGYSPRFAKTHSDLVPPTGFEPAAFCSGGSYEPFAVVWSTFTEVRPWSVNRGSDLRYSAAHVHDGL